MRAARGQLDDVLKAAIAAAKPELLALLAAGGRTGPVSVPRPERGGPLPLSPFQERLWYLHRLDPTDTSFNLAIALASDGQVDVEHVRRSIAALVRRHEVLRSTFRDEDGLPSMWLVPETAVPIAVVDLSALDGQGWQDAVRAAVAGETHRPFELAKEPPVRFSLFRLPGGRVAALATAHHVAVDAWSMRIIGTALEACFRGEPAVDAPLPIQYADFAAWQRATLAAEGAVHLEWWKRRMEGAPPLSTFASDPQPGGTREGGNTHTFRLGRELSERVRAFARGEGATVYMTLVAAFAAVLRWHTGQDDVVLGNPMGVRETADLERLVGPFVNVLPVRLDLSSDPTFGELVHQVRGALLDAHEHRHVTYEALVEHLKPPRSLEHEPLMQLAVVQHNVPSSGQTTIVSGGSIFDLTWYVHEDAGELVGALEYRTALFSSAFAARLAARITAALEGALAYPGRPLSALALTSADERAQVLEAFNATARAVDRATVVEQIARQAARTPDRCAVVFEGAELTYRELVGRAAQVAHHLRAQGVRPGVVVGHCMPRSLDLPVALLGVLAAGGAYLPLDPEFPAERLSFMLADAGVRAVVTSGKLPAGVVVPPGVALLDLAAARAALEALPLEPPAGGAGQGDTAYLIYTSGSTGRPKGVRVPHRALSNFLDAMREAPGMGPADVLAAVTTLSFDIAGLELWLPLTVGARVLLLPKATAASGTALAEAIARGGATVLQATPATWRLLVEAGWRGAPGFRALCGGEALPRELADALLGRVGDLWNVYGPTETTIWSTAGRVEPGAGPVLIGRPIANTWVYVLDRGGQPLPPGIAGELWIGGDGVAEGYHARPELTAERFVADPFRPGGRMYRTGDLARWTAGGLLEHLGRLDHQVKVRGFRIELGEIESTLAAHPAIRQAVVIARDAGGGDVRLVAYLVFHPGEDLTVSEVRRHLRKALPEYMVPSFVVTLGALPLTPNGKLDRAALPDPVAAAPRAAAKVPPAPGLEQVLAEIWREILSLDAVGAEDNFFELGGHSLLSLRVAAAVEKRTGWRMDPRLLFFRTLRQVAEAAAAAGARG